MSNVTSIDTWLKRRVFIYLLRDPETDAVRYVGQALNPAARRTHHVANPANKLKDWILGLRSENRIPALQVVEETTQAEADEREIFWIHFYHKRGCQLLNTNHVPNPEPKAPRWLVERAMLEEQEPDSPKVKGLKCRQCGHNTRKSWQSICSRCFNVKESAEDILRGVAEAA